MRKKFEYFEPETIEEAISLLVKYKGQARLFAGGTDLLPLMKQEVVSPQYLINIKKNPGLDYINPDNGKGLKVGALTTLHAIETSPVIREKCGILAQAASKVASLQIRNIGSIAGNICQGYRCWYYNQSHDWRKFWAPCYKRGGDICYADKGAKRCQNMVLRSDTAPALIALGAKVKLVGEDGERVIPIKDFFEKTGNRLRGDEILTEIQIPDQPPHACGVYLRWSPRRALDYPVVGTAVIMEMDTENSLCRNIKIIFSSVAPVPFEVDEAEDFLRGKKIDSDIIDMAAQIVRDSVATKAIKFGDHSADYKTTMAGILIKQSIEDCLKLAK